MSEIWIEHEYQNIASFMVKGKRSFIGHVNTRTGEYCPRNLKELLDSYLEVGFAFSSSIRLYAESVVGLARRPRMTLDDIVRP